MEKKAKNAVACFRFGHFIQFVINVPRRQVLEATSNGAAKTRTV
jgi:hypothetical protein